MKNMYKKGQAATEFLMTYGWAILAIVIVAAVLWNMGIFKGQCNKTAAVQVFPSGESLAAADWNLGTDNNLTLNVKNLAGSDITIDSGNVRLSGSTNPDGGLVGTASVSSGNSDILWIDSTGTGTSGNCFNDIKVTLRYSVSGGVTHNVTGTLQGKY